MDDGSGCLGILLIVLNIGAVVGSGFLAWNWVEPDDFWLGLLFVVVWGVLSAVGHWLVQLIVAGLSALFGN